MRDVPGKLIDDCMPLLESQTSDVILQKCPENELESVKYSSTVRFTICSNAWSSSSFPTSTFRPLYPRSLCVRSSHSLLVMCESLLTREFVEAGALVTAFRLTRQTVAVAVARR